jgi:predicted nucleotidyltransferase
MMEFDPEPFAKAMRQRNEAEKLAMAEKREQAVAEARRLAVLIKAKVAGVEKVILFGSVAENSVRSVDFDIDLALLGGDVYLAEDVAADSSFRIDIADFNRLPDHLRSRILERGIVLS